MIRSEINFAVLEWVSHDYEAPHTIAGNVSLELGRSVTQTEIFEALLALASEGLVQPYVFNKESSEYQKIDFSKLSKQTDPWFLATPTGRATCDDAR